MSSFRTVLVVDDEDQLLRLMTRLIERTGRPVLAAANAAEARALFQKHVGEIGLVLLDVTMPGGDGAEKLLPEFSAARPDLQVVVTSGDAMPPSLEEELERVGGSFLRKPFVPKTLLALLVEKAEASEEPDVSKDAEAPEETGALPVPTAVEPS
jgi:DNA-binding NtrC family response regulator